MAWEENSRICLHMQLIAILSRIGVTYGVTNRKNPLTRTCELSTRLFMLFAICCDYKCMLAPAIIHSPGCFTPPRS